MSDSKWEYIIVEESEVNPKLIQKLNDLQIEYEDMLGTMSETDPETRDIDCAALTPEQVQAEIDQRRTKLEAKNRAALNAFYARGQKELMAVESDNIYGDLIKLYMHIHNMVRKIKHNVKKHSHLHFYNTKDSQGNFNNDIQLTTEQKSDIINYKKPYSDLHRKKWLLKQMLPSGTIEQAYHQLYPNRDFNEDFEQEERI